jgi:DNA-binding NarL/FixJ family response regulator
VKSDIMVVCPKILCIEDDLDTMELLVETLNEEGFTVIAAHDGVEGVKKFSERPELILCDIDMPTMNGFGVLQALRRAPNDLKNVPFLFITAYGSRDSHLRARQLGCDDFISKPLDFELLVAILRHRLAYGFQNRTADFSLTVREREVLTWVARGKSSSDIGLLTGLSERTVNFHASNVMRKMGVATRVQAAIRCALLGLIDP